MMRAEIINPVDSVKAQRVDMTFLKPIERVLDEQFAHGRAIGFIEVYRFAPRGVITTCEKWAKRTEIIAFGTKMVVDHVQNHGYSAGMRCINELLKSDWSSIRILRGKRVASVVTPIPRAGKLRYGHDFDRCNAQIAQHIEAGDGCGERAFACERAHV